MKSFRFKNNKKLITIIGVVAIVIALTSAGFALNKEMNKQSSEAKKNITTTVDNSQVNKNKEKEAKTKDQKKKEIAEKKKEASQNNKNVSKKTASKKNSNSNGNSSSKSSNNGNTNSNTKYCTLTVNCKTAINSNELSSSKRANLPKDGIIFSKRVKINSGETVYDVLKREMRNNGIPLDSVKTPGYGTQYIRGIKNLYEMDCGDLSGWMYKVNGSFSSKGCDQYKVSSGDNIQFVYTCDKGDDIGGNY